MVAEGSPVATKRLGDWLVRRMFCCAGAVVLVQNLMLLNWTTQMQITTPAPCTSAPTSEPIPPSPEPPPAAPAVTGWREEVEEAKAMLESKSKLVQALEEEVASLKAKIASSPGVQVEAPPVPKVAPMTVATSVESVRLSDPTSRQLGRESSLYAVSRDELRIFGNPVPPGVSMAVGFGSVKRKKDYVMDTVSLMLGLQGETHLSPEERNSVVIVAHFADFDTAWVNQTAGKLQEQYKDLIAAGQFHALHAKEEFYPPLDICPPTCNYKDNARRVRWRSKQNIDYAFLMYYAASLAPYYLQLEDDINFAHNWVSKINDFVTSSYPPTYKSKENAPWRMIDFSQLGFIGKYFQANELTRLAQFLLLFYDQMPCDILINQWMLSMTQGKKIEYFKSHTSLFQHVGVFRTLGDGYQILQDTKFGKTLWDNPAGEVTKNLTIVPTYDVKFLYFPNGEPAKRKDVCDFSASPKQKTAKRCWLWATHVQAGQHVTLTFASAVKVKALLFEFGSDFYPKDLLGNGVIQIAGGQAAQGQAVFCSKFLDLMPVKRDRVIYWEEGVSAPPSLPVNPVSCIRILVLQAQAEWINFWSIQVRREWENKPR